MEESKDLMLLVSLDFDYSVASL